MCLDVEGPAGAAPDLEAVDEITHIAVVDRSHEVDRAFGIVNVPMAVWIDEDLQVVRPAEFAWPGEVEGAGMAQLPPDLPDRMMEMGAMAAQILSADHARGIGGLVWVAEPNHGRNP